ncbi:MAG TPA: biopolymer transporter ExbD [Tepidisphaeraceae bacterium]|jgi:biopolymer transport protein ExbD|nr:biopolymer transporter ExbD [Tepidisphaeraceae bacterium]
MRIHDPVAEAEEPYNLIPLTDMVFNLLIFFMCATTFVQVEKEMSLELPRTGSTKGMANPASAELLIINIDREGKIIIAGKDYDKEALARRVTDAVAKRKDQAVVIRADERSFVEYFADVARICTQAGVKEVKLVYLNGAQP